MLIAAKAHCKNKIKQHDASEIKAIGKANKGLSNTERAGIARLRTTHRLTVREQEPVEQLIVPIFFRQR